MVKAKRKGKCDARYYGFHSVAIAMQLVGYSLGMASNEWELEETFIC